MGFYMIVPKETFMEYTLRVVFPGSFSLADFIIANSCLLEMFRKRLFLEKLAPRDREDVHAYAQMCLKNLENGLARLPVHMPNDMTHILAVLQGVTAIWTTFLASYPC